MEPLIATKNITVAYNQAQPALENVSLNIQPQDFLSLVGPNGAGKTTLLKVLLGVLKPNSGTINRQKNLKIGYMPQKLLVSPLLPLSAKRFLTLGHKNKDIAAVIETVGIQDIINQPLSGLSGGEMQRVLLARALQNNPNVLMLDEPVQNLDVRGQVAFYELLEKLYQQHKFAIVMVNHDLHMVMRATRKVICLYHHICCEGKPADVSQHPNFIKLFGQDMSKLLKFYQHEHDHTHQH